MLAWGALNPEIKTRGLFGIDFFAQLRLCFFLPISPSVNLG